ncbi:SMC-Scp complex subunit ScpB [Mycoplasmopsis ciconiae]|uniref:Segregation and condensation protein B n=1 Tax=Mycoplasmopsis ciconiae TaxID=561067 RepID=A0ABU7MLS3_9BACT|nr:SMC-Scp complex subunit ScpB [Mycoplasmopsis ciconiae]
MKDNIIEGLLYVQGEEGLTLEQVVKVFSLNNKNEAKKLMNDFVHKFNALDRGLKVQEFNEVYKLSTRESIKEYIFKLYENERKQRLSNAAIEVAGIVAYKQPVTRGQIALIRGVSSDQVLNTLILKGVVEEVGVSPTVGNPTLYGVTNKFYDYFKIKSMADLPKLNDFNYLKEGDENEEFDLFSSQRENF